MHKKIQFAKFHVKSSQKLRKIPSKTPKVSDLKQIVPMAAINIVDRLGRFLNMI